MISTGDVILDTFSMLREQNQTQQRAIKRTVHPEMKILPPFTLPNAFPNQYDLYFLWDLKGHLEEHTGLFYKAIIL